jgi:hypothetical protein
MLPAVINILGNKSGDPRKTRSFPAELHLDIAEPGRICQATEKHAKGSKSVFFDTSLWAHKIFWQIKV